MICVVCSCTEHNKSSNVHKIIVKLKTLINLIVKQAWRLTPAERELSPRSAPDGHHHGHKRHSDGELPPIPFHFDSIHSIEDLTLVQRTFHCMQSMKMIDECLFQNFYKYIFVYKDLFAFYFFFKLHTTCLKKLLKTYA